MRSIFCLKLEAVASTTPLECATEAERISKLFGVIVVFDFNRVKAHYYPNGGPPSELAQDILNKVGLPDTELKFACN